METEVVVAAVPTVIATVTVTAAVDPDLDHRHGLLEVWTLLFQDPKISLDPTILSELKL